MFWNAPPQAQRGTILHSNTLNTKRSGIEVDAKARESEASREMYWGLGKSREEQKQSGPGMRGCTSTDPNGESRRFCQQRGAWEP